MTMRRLFSKRAVALRGLSKSLTWFSIVSLLLLPFVHFHPEYTHSHSGHLAVHHHEGHFHSDELETLVHYINAHPDDAESDAPLHPSHSSPEHDSDYVQYTIAVLGTLDKDVARVNQVFEASSNSPELNLVSRQAHYEPPPYQYQRLSRYRLPVRGPPSV